MDKNLADFLTALVILILIPILIIFYLVPLALLSRPVIMELSRSEIAQKMVLNFSQNSMSQLISVIACVALTIVVVKKIKN
jgi:hypothetical protein